MNEILERLSETPLSLIFILAGIFFLVVSVANKLGAKVDINPKRQGQAVIIGGVLVLTGLVLYLEIPEKDPDPVLGKEHSAIECFISVYSARDEYIVTNSEICQIHISRGGYQNEGDANTGKNDTRFRVDMDGKKLPPDSEPETFGDSNEWHIEQFFNTIKMKPGNEYIVEAWTLTGDGQVLDSSSFTVFRE
ncbi:MAG: hypothetical protein ACQETJ_01760 [Bacteroidota bacterium]